MVSYTEYWKKICNLHNIPYNYKIFLNLHNLNYPQNANIELDKKYQSGGVYPKKIFKEIVLKTNQEKEIFSHNSKKILFFKTIGDDIVTYSIRELNNDELSECLLIQIELNVKIFTTKEHNNVANIMMVYNEGKCNYHNSNNKITGSDLIDIAIQFIKSKKTQYKISMIYLTDNSNKLCKGIKSKKMSIIYTLLNGDTWYGSKGFRPFDISEKNEIYKYADYYNKNLLLNKLVKVKHIKNLQEKIKNGYKKYLHMSDNLNKNKLIELINDEEFDKKYGNNNLGEFLKFLLNNNLINCYIYFDFADDIFENIKVKIEYDNNKMETIRYRDFYGKAFYLEI